MIYDYEMKFNSSTPEYYRLDDGCFWSISEAKFVSSVPDNAKTSPCPDEHGESTLDGLIGCLEFYGFDKGELKTDAEYATEVRAERDKRIASTDYLAMPDYPLTEDKRVAVLAYRQALRDIPEQSGFQPMYRRNLPDSY